MTSQTTARIGRGSQAAYRVLTLSGLLVALAVRLYRLGAESLWYDETVSAFLARQPFSQMLAHTALDIHPPGYYALLHAWTRISAAFAGPGMEFLLAYPSAWFGVLSVALLVPLGCLLLGRTVAVLGVWIAALSPFLIWYGQEVRMYTVAGALGLLCLLAALRFTTHAMATSPSHAQRTPTVAWLAVYAVSAAAGVYTLYYFAFALLAINAAVFVSLLLSPREQGHTRYALASWIAAQGIVVLLVSPWLPTLLRQVLNPPVPPWREPWTGVREALVDAASALAAYTVGQSVPSRQIWLWAALSISLMSSYYGYTKSLLYPPGPGANPRGFALWLPFYVLIPPLTIFAVTAFTIPLFHARYLVTYAPAFALIASAGLIYLYRRRRALLGLVAFLLVAGMIYSMSRAWRHPDYRPDDHRSAVAQLAQQWRPGDAILVNAGWVYTAIDTYWPRTVEGPDASLPPGPVRWLRLTSAEDPNVVAADPLAQAQAGPPAGYATGSIDGAASLGWGSEEADFYALSRADAVAALEDVVNSHVRIWHYRLYDTVNDLEGVIRDWLSANQRLQSATTFSGDGYLRLEQYVGDARLDALAEGSTLPINFANGLTLSNYQVPDRAQAGSYVYVPLAWLLQPSYVAGDVLAASLRLVDADGQVWAQHDEPLPDLIAGALAGGVHDQVLALPIPASTPPGRYGVHLVVYDAEGLLPIQRDTGSGPAQDAQLGTLQVELPAAVPVPVDKLTSFDYLDLVQARVPGSAESGQPLGLDLVWRPSPSSYADAYTARISLTNGEGTAVAAWEEPLGPDQYPSSAWATSYPVRDKYRLILPEGVPHGEYRLLLEILRTSDRLRLPSRPRPWLPFSTPAYELGRISVIE